MRKHISTILLVLVFFVGLSVMLYPMVSDWWNGRVSSEAIVDYEKLLSNLDERDFGREFAKAQKYNEDLRKISHPLVNYKQLPEYEDILNLTGEGIIGYIRIDKIKVELPIYHTSQENVLRKAVGHIEGSSLPVGGESSHAVLSAHRGLPSAKLFSDLDQLKEGDTFVIKVLNRTLTYQVNQIRIVLPEEVEELYIQEGKDYCTLLTCTPYGINTHRLLVRGVRTDNINADSFISSEAYELDSLILAPVVAVPILLILLMLLLIKYRRKKGE